MKFLDKFTYKNIEKVESENFSHNFNNFHY